MNITNEDIISIYSKTLTDETGYGNRPNSHCYTDANDTSDDTLNNRSPPTLLQALSIKCQEGKASSL